VVEWSGILIRVVEGEAGLAVGKVEKGTPARACHAGGCSPLLEV
jgi:hypothetical protein